MAKSNKFSLFDQLATGSPVSKSDTQIVNIRLDQIDDNEGNFYKVGNVDDLAESIELVGLQQPLVVRRAGERFVLIAGHRRRKALTQLGRTDAPCIITDDAGGDTDDAYAELRLIMTNSTARELTYAERMEQVQKVEKAIVRLAEQGVELPGKLRDRVAEITKESASEIARMKVIDAKLAKSWRSKLAKGQISSSVAYEIARLPAHAQTRLHKAFSRNIHFLTAKAVRAAQVNYAYDWVPDTCPLSPKDLVDMCSRVGERAAYKDKHPDCPGCCKGCEKAEDCKLCCGAQAKRIKADAEFETRQKEIAEADAAFEASSFARMQRRCIEVLKDFGIESRMQLEEKTGLSYWDVCGMLSCSRGDAKVPLATYCSVADALGISLAQLLGLDTVPAAEPVRWRCLWDSPGRDMDVLVMFRRHDTPPHIRTARYAHGEFIMPLDNDPEGDTIPLAHCFTHWAPAPEDETE